VRDIAAPRQEREGTQSAAVEIMLNSRYMAELIEKGEISEMKEAMEKALTPGSQTFEQSLFKMIRDGLITQDEALSNADSRTICSGSSTTPRPAPILRQARTEALRQDPRRSPAVLRSASSSSTPARRSAHSIDAGRQGPLDFPLLGRFHRRSPCRPVNRQRRSGSLAS